MQPASPIDVLDLFPQMHTQLLDLLAPAPDGTHVRIEITGDAGGAWSLVRADARWALYTAVDTTPHAATTLDQETAWRLFSMGITPDEARPRATLSGDASLAAQVLKTVSIIA
jgi:hypothetical protein